LLPPTTPRVRSSIGSQIYAYVLEPIDDFTPPPEQQRQHSNLQPAHLPPMATPIPSLRSAGNIFLASLAFWPWASPCFFGEGAAISFVAPSPRATSTRRVEQVRPTRWTRPRPGPHHLSRPRSTTSDGRFALHIAPTGGDETVSWSPLSAEASEVQQISAEPASPPADVSPHAGAYWQILRPHNIPLSFGLVAAGALVASHAPDVVLNPKV